MQISFGLKTSCILSVSHLTHFREHLLASNYYSNMRRLGEFGSLYRFGLPSRLSGDHFEEWHSINILCCFSNHFREENTVILSMGRYPVGGVRTDHGVTLQFLE